MMMVVIDINIGEKGRAVALRLQTKTNEMKCKFKTQIRTKPINLYSRDLIKFDDRHGRNMTKILNKFFVVLLFICNMVRDRQKCKNTQTAITAATQQKCSIFHKL